MPADFAQDVDLTFGFLLCELDLQQALWCGSFGCPEPVASLWRKTMLAPGRADEKMKVLRSVTMSVTLLVAGCATESADISPSYVSPVAYQNYTCEQLAQEARRVSTHAANASGQQDKQRSNDAVVTTVGVVLFWPALFFIDGDGPKAAEVARLKGEMDAIEAAAIQNNCQFTFKRK